MAPLSGSSSQHPEQDREAPYDYTEGASALDISHAVDNNRRSRRDSQFSTYYDNDEGAMYSGPGHTVNPSSVSRMSHMELGRRSSDNWLSRRRSVDSRMGNRNRRDSRSSQVSRQSIEGTQEPVDDLSGDDDVITKRRQQSPSTPPQRASVFGNIANLFGRTPGAPDASGNRRPSLSQRSSRSRLSRRSGDGGSEYAVETEDEGEERWGYSSGEEYSDEDEAQLSEPDRQSITASMDYDSEPPSPTEAHQGLPLLNIDPVFGGESRIEMDTEFTLLEPPPPGPPSRQTIHIPDEDSTVRFVGYETIRWRVWAWRVFCTLTGGILALLGHWFPKLWLRWVAQEKAFIDSRNGFIVVEVSLDMIMAASPLIHLGFPQL